MIQIRGKLIEVGDDSQGYPFATFDVNGHEILVSYLRRETVRVWAGRLMQVGLFSENDGIAAFE